MVVSLQVKVTRLQNNWGLDSEVRKYEDGEKRGQGDKETGKGIKFQYKDLLSFLIIRFKSPFHKTALL